MHDVVCSVPQISSLVLARGGSAENTGVCVRCAAFRPNDTVPFVSCTELAPVVGLIGEERWHVVALQIPDDAKEAILSVCSGALESSAIKAHQLCVVTLHLSDLLASGRVRVSFEPSCPEIKLVHVPRDVPPTILTKRLIARPLSAAYAFPGKNTILRETCGEVCFGYELPRDFLVMRLTQLEVMVQQHEILLQNVRQCQGIFSDNKSAVRWGYFPCAIRIVGIRGLAQNHRIPGSTSNSSPFVSVSIESSISGTGEFSRRVGRTNTEYRTADPVYGTNSNVRLCEHANPQLEFEPGRYGRITADGQWMECYVRDGDRLIFTVYHERHSVYQGITNHVMCQAQLSFTELVADDHQVKELELRSISGARQSCGKLFVVALLREKPSNNPFDLLEFQTTLEESVLGNEGALRNIPAYWLSVLINSMKATREILETMLKEVQRRMSESNICFKASTDKKKIPQGAITTNLHLSEFDLCSTQAPYETRSRVAYTTCGVPSAMSLGVKDVSHSLSELNSRLRHACAKIGVEESCLSPCFDLTRLVRLRPDSITSGKDAPFSDCSCSNPILCVDETCGSSSHRASAKARATSLAPSSRSTAAFRSIAASVATKITGNSTPQAVVHHTSDATSSLAKLAAPWQSASEIQVDQFLRESVAVSQALAPTASAFLSEACLAITRGPSDARSWGEQILRAGFLIGWESLISTHGSEMCMLADVIGVVDFVNSKCAIEVISSNQESPSARVREGENDQVIIVIELNEMDFVQLFPTSSETRLKISIVLVLFAQGVNETQSLANYLNKEYAAQQAVINRTSISLLMKYALSLHNAAPLAVLRLNAVVETQREDEKEVDVLLMADDAIRALRGARQIMCKSGKDRTAMAVTLEQSRIAGTLLDASKIRDLANLMRELGVRIKVAEKNVGSGMYSFNVLQRMTLPRDYRPPLCVIQDMSTSYLKKDS